MTWIGRYLGGWVSSWLGPLVSGGTIVEAAATLRGTSGLRAAGAVEAAGPVVEAGAVLPGTSVLEALAEVIEGVVAPSGGWVGPVSWPIQLPGRLVLAGATLSGYGDLEASSQARPGKAKQARQLVAAIFAFKKLGA